MYRLRRLNSLCAHTVATTDSARTLLAVVTVCTTVTQAWLAKNLVHGQSVGVDPSQLSYSNAKYVVGYAGAFSRSNRIWDCSWWECTRRYQSTCLSGCGSLFVRNKCVCLRMCRGLSVIVPWLHFRNIEKELQTRGIDLVPVNNLVDQVGEVVDRLYCLCPGLFIHRMHDVGLLLLLLLQIWEDRPSFPSAPAFVHPLSRAGMDVATKLSLVRVTITIRIWLYCCRAGCMCMCICVCKLLRVFS